MRKIDSTFVPVGMQYYRPPTPDRSVWAEDMKNIAALGCNTVRYWAMWRWMHTGPGRFDFTDFDELFELAHKNGLKVVINIILDTAPAWVLNKYPDAHFVYANGEKIKQVSNACRQIGGVPGVGFYHKQAQAEAVKFMTRLSKQYASHPALLAWDLWNEPELCMNQRWFVESDLYRQADYSPSSLKAFQDWLKKRYKNIDSLNKAWSRRYLDFSEVEAPIETMIYRDITDWKIFWADTLVMDMKRRYQAVAKHDKKHPLYCHTVPAPGVNLINGGKDDWTLAEAGDAFGGSYPYLGRPTVEYTMIQSACKDKDNWAAEGYLPDAGPGDTITPSALALFRERLWLPVFFGANAYIKWQYRNETIGQESAWHYEPGTFDSNEELRDEFMQAARCFHDLPLGSLKPKVSGVAMLISPQCECAGWSANGWPRHYYDALSGHSKALEEINLPYLFIHEKDLRTELSKHKVLIAAMPAFLSRDSFAPIKDWVRDGGILIAEAPWASIRHEDGIRVNGLADSGFEEVFGATQRHYRKENDPIDSKDLTIVWNRKKIMGKEYLLTLHPGSAKVLAKDEYGHPAVTENKYGKGKACFLGSLFSYAFEKEGGAYGELLRSLLPKDIVKAVPVAKDCMIRMIEDDKKMWVFIKNLQDKKRSLNLSLFEKAKELRDLISGESYSAVAGKFRLPLDAGGVRIFETEK